jgi:hypothetical protein
MAETAETTAPGTHPDAVVINQDGSVTTKAGKGWVWCTDESTGHRLDFPAHLLPRKGVTPVPGYPVNYRPVARAPKTQVQLGDTPPTAGHPTAAAGAVPAEVAAARAAEASVTTTTDPRLPASDAGTAQSTGATGAATSSTKGRSAR